MPAYSFQPQFVEPIRAGTKGGTIRAERKRQPTAGTPGRPGGHARLGEAIALYCRQRHPSGFLIARHRCIAAEPIRLDFGTDGVELRHSKVVLIGAEQLGTFARFDGFGCWDDMRKFWIERHHTDEFRGWHIRWLPLPFFEARR